MKKAQSSLIEYVLTIFLGLIVLIAVSFIITSFYTSALKQDITRSLNEIDLQVSNALSKTYQQGKASTASPTNSTIVLLANINLNLPKRISGKNYEIDLLPLNTIFATVSNVTSGTSVISTVIQSFGAKIVARTTDDPQIVVSKDLGNIDVNVQGSVLNGMNATLRYYRYNFNGTIYDKIILGEQGIIININQIS